MTATAPDRKSQRRTVEPLALWVAYSLGSVLIHLLAITTLQRMMVRQETVELSNANIPIEIVEITPQTSSLKPANVPAKESKKAIAPPPAPEPTLETKNEAIAPLSTPEPTLETKNEAIAPPPAPEPTLETKNESSAPPSAPEPTLETKNEAIAPKEEEMQEPPSLPKPAEIKKANYQQNSSVIAKSERLDPSVSSSTVERVETKPRTKVKTPTKTRSRVARRRSPRVRKYVKRIPLQERSPSRLLEPKRGSTENVDPNSTKKDEPAQTAPLANENLSPSTEPKKRTPVTPVVGKLLPTRSPSPDSSESSDSDNVSASPEESDSQNSAKETGSSSNPSPAIPAPQKESANDRPKANSSADKPANSEEKKSSDKDSPASTPTGDREPAKSKPVASAPPATESPKSEEDSRGLVATLSDVRLANGGRDNPDRVAKPRKSQKQFNSMDYPSKAKGKQNRVLVLEVKLLIDDKGNPEVQSAQVVKGTSSVSPRQLASEIIQGWKFEPAYQAKQPVYSNMEVVLRIAPLAN